VSSFVETKKYSPGTTPSPEILVRPDLPPPDSSESGHLLPCSTSTVTDRKRSPITLNKNSTRAFQRATTKVLRRPQLPQNGDKVPKFVVFWTISTIKDEKSAEKFHCIKDFSGKVVAQSIVFRVVSIYWLGVAPFP